MFYKIKQLLNLIKKNNSLNLSSINFVINIFFNYFVILKLIIVNNSNNNLHVNLYKLKIFKNIYINNLKIKINNLFLILKNISKKYMYTLNHKKLGLLYLYLVFFTSIEGSYLATCIRLEMAYPGSPLFDGNSLKYLQIISAHALIMIFFVVVPIFFGGFANFLLPYHIGSKDVAYPRLNNLGFWIQPCGFLLIVKLTSITMDYWFSEIKITYVSQFLQNNNNLLFKNYSEIYQNFENTNEFVNIFFIENKWKTSNIKSIEINEILKKINKLYNKFENFFTYKWLIKNNINFNDYWMFTKNAFKSKRYKRFLIKNSNAPQTVSGWTFITPFSSNVEYTGYGVQDMLILGVYFVGISTTISVLNLLITRRILSISGLKNRRILVPFISITILLMLRALSVITPVLGSAMLMLLADRHWCTSFFDFSYGGDPIFFQHLFWFFGHPEVYVLIIPAFGVINSILPNSNYRRIASKHHLIWAIYVMNYMGFLVWGHHMYLIGLDHRSRALYSTITIMISLPATIKVVNWTFTLMNGGLKIDITFFSIISFIFFFLVAGFTGMWLSHVSLNISTHDTLYVVAHFHLMLSGAVVMGIFSGFYYYYFIFFQLKYSKNLAYLHIIYYTIGQWMTFIPLFWLAFSGLPRRVHDFPSIYIGWQTVSSSGHMLTMIGVIFFYCGFIESLIEKKNYINLIDIITRFNKKYILIINKFISKKLNFKKLNFKKLKFI